jgi:hypothetical protein
VSEPNFHAKAGSVHMGMAKSGLTRECTWPQRDAVCAFIEAELREVVMEYQAAERERMLRWAKATR